MRSPIGFSSFSRTPGPAAPFHHRSSRVPSMKLSRLSRLLLVAATFNTACLTAYALREDYFHKQTDQFYYLSIADSLRLTGEMRVRIDPSLSLPVTANAGAAFLMLPLSSLRADHVFLAV